MNDQRKLNNASLQPELGSDFQCVAQKCALSCCVGWNVALDKETYRQYKNDADLAQNITKKVHGISRSSQAFGTIKRNAGGECSMLTPEGLCSVQKSLGEKALSKTCGTFPRENFHFHNLNVRSFSTTCPEVARLTVASEEAMKLVDQPMAKKGESRQYIFRRGSFSSNQKNLFFAIYNFFSTSSLPMWKKVIAARSVISAVDESARLSEGHFSAILFEKQLELSLAELELDPTLIQWECLVPPIIERSLLNSMNIPLKTLKTIGTTDGETGSNNEISKKQLLEVFMKKRGLLFRPSQLNKDWVWTNLFLSELLGSVDKFNSKHSLEAFDLSVLRLALIKFTYVCALTPQKIDDPAYLGLVSAIVTRKLKDVGPMFKQVMEDLRSKYEDESAIVPLLVA